MVVVARVLHRAGPRGLERCKPTPRASCKAWGAGALEVRITAEGPPKNSSDERGARELHLLVEKRERAKSFDPNPAFGKKTIVEVILHANLGTTNMYSCATGTIHASPSPVVVLQKS